MTRHIRAIVRSKDMSYLDTYNLAHDEDFRKRVQTAALIVATPGDWKE